MREAEDKNLERILNRDIFPMLAEKVADTIKGIPIAKLYGLEEIRIRAERPLVLHIGGQSFFIDNRGELTENASAVSRSFSGEQIQNTMLMMSNYSLYAIEDELRNGFITLQGGHRVGFVGKAVSEGNHIRVIKNISSLNIRIAREVKGCSDGLIRELYKEGIRNTMVISPPGCGKTTLLRDIVRNLSNGGWGLESSQKGYKICVIDERSEIAGCYLGIPQKDIGLRTDVLDGSPKAAGIYLALRSMSPDIIAVDELGSDEELPVLRYAMNCGVKIIATAHGNDYQDLVRRKNFRELVDNGLVDKLVVLSRKRGPCTIESIIELEKGGGSC